MGSTNDSAAELLAAGALEPPAVVVTGHQTAGRGQRGKGWFSSSTSLAASFVVLAEGRPVHQVPLLVGLVVRGVVADLLGDREGRPASSQLRLSAGPTSGPVQVKWPNDVLIRGRKVAGILCERHHGADIIGIGINVSHEPGEVPAELRDSIVALSDGGVAPDRWEVLAALAEVLRREVVDASLDASWSKVLSTWPAHDALLGRMVEVSTPQGSIIGEARGIDDSGQLRIVTASGRVVSIASGTVRPRDKT